MNNHYPLWLRVWHWLNALLFMVLTATGLSLHFADPGMTWISFDGARVTHNVCGLAMIANYIVYLLGNFWGGNYIHYIPKMAGLWTRMKRQIIFYGDGIFRGEEQPFPPQAECKFNPLQQWTYLGVMMMILPLLMVTGVLFLFPDWLPERMAGMDGVWPVAVLHTLLGFMLMAFLLGHLYLATAGETLTSEFYKMITGHHGPAHPKHDAVAGDAGGEA